MDELEALRTHLGLTQLHILGHSFGGMLLLDYLFERNPAGVGGIILASAVPGVTLWGEEQRRLAKDLPEEMQRILWEAFQTGDYGSDAYQWANAEYIRRHVCPDWNFWDPECLTRPVGSGYEAYVTAWGPTEFWTLGNLGDFERIGDLHKIKQPTLITTGLADSCTPLIARTMLREVPDARWELFVHSRHMAFAEERDKYIAVLRDWLNDHE